MLLLSHIRATPSVYSRWSLPQRPEPVLHVRIASGIDPVVVECSRDGFHLKSSRIGFRAGKHIHDLRRDYGCQQPHDDKHNQKFKQCDPDSPLDLIEQNNRNISL